MAGKKKRKKSKNAALAARLRRMSGSKKRGRKVSRRRRGMRGFGLGSVKLRDAIAPAVVAVATTVGARLLKRAAKHFGLGKDPNSFYAKHSDAIETTAAAAIVVGGTMAIKPLRKYTGTAIATAGTIVGFEVGKIVVDKFLPEVAPAAKPPGQLGYGGDVNDITGSDNVGYDDASGIGMAGIVDDGIDGLASDPTGTMFSMNGMVDRGIEALARAA